MTDEKAEQILQRLDIIVSLMLESGPDGEPPLKEKIMRLDSLGLTPTEIGHILRKPPNQITGELSRQRKKSVAKPAQRSTGPNHEQPLP